MTFEEAKVVVREIMQNTSVSEQARLLDFFQSPKAEPFREAATIKFKSKQRGPHGDDPAKPITMAVATGKI